VGLRLTNRYMLDSAPDSKLTEAVGALDPVVSISTFFGSKDSQPHEFSFHPPVMDQSLFLDYFEFDQV
jgi:hypothetical protein